MTDRSHEIEGRVVAHLEELAEQRDSFDRGSKRLGEERFVAAWSRSGVPDDVDLKGSIERAYEQVVNDLQGLLDLLETEAASRGVVPSPVLVGPAASGESIAQWWKDAAALGFDVSKSNQSNPPGRWRRLALYGYLDHDLATDLIAWTDNRNLFQHAYAQRNPARGREVWATMHSLREQLQPVVDAILALQAR